MKRIALALASSWLLAAPALAHATEYELDPAHSEAEFVVKHMMVTNVRGYFRKMTGTAVLDDAKPESDKVEVTIEAASVDTNNEKRDTHLKSPDFFDVAKFPSLSFKSKAVKPLGEGKFAVLGDLTLHGVTKEVTLNIDGLTPETKSPWGGVSRGVTGTAKVNRKDFGLVWNKALESGGVLVGDEVTINIDVELNLTKKAGPKAASK